MPTLSVRVSEDLARPQGHAIVTLNGLPPGLETFEFALTRHGFTASHLGPDGWQGAECWVQPDEVWYAGDALKFVVPPELACQLENMPYRLAVRGQGLAGTMTVDFRWPLELELEEGSVSGERRVVGGTRVEAGPKLRPATEPPPLLEVGGVVVDIPDVLIPEIGASPEPMDDRLPTRVTPSQTGVSKPAGEDPKTPPDVRSDSRSSVVPDSTVSPGPDSTRKISERLVPPVRPDREMAAEAAAPAPPGPEPVREEPTRVLPPQPEPGSDARPAEGAGAVGQRRRWVSGLLAGLLVLAVLAAGWWFGHRASEAPPVAPAPSTVPSGNLAPEPLPAPEPVVPIRPEPPVSQPVAPAPKPVEPVRPVAPEPAIPSVRPDSDRGLEEELKSEFDPTLQELEKRLRGEKSR
jgi:hypothetical protein